MLRVFNALLSVFPDSLRRAFHRWLTVKRAVEHRRLMHQRKVAQIRQILLISAWERWRERFKEERLRPLVRFLPPCFFFWSMLIISQGISTHH